jgi:Rrf2 family protein
MNKCAAYAIAALSALAAHKGSLPLSNSAICDRADLPDGFVLQLLRKLTLSGIVTSVRGIHGGFKLAKPAHRISLLEIREAIDGPIEPASFDGNELTAASQMLIAGMLLGAAYDERRRLAAVTLDMLKFNG